MAFVAGNSIKSKHNGEIVIPCYTHAPFPSFVFSLHLYSHQQHRHDKVLDVRGRNFSRAVVPTVDCTALWGRRWDYLEGR
jgi:hypothetical protein